MNDKAEIISEDLRITEHFFCQMKDIKINNAFIEL